MTNTLAFKSSIYDDQFTKTKQLRWLPFVGNQYSNGKEKLLIVGESHFLSDKEGSKESHDNNDFTRHVVNEQGALRKYPKKNPPKLFPNLHKALFGNSKFKSEVFWDNVSFYNFIQRPMTHKKDRPKKADYVDGWYTFIKTIEILKPTSCLMLGTSSSNSVKKALDGSGYTIAKSKKHPKISGTFPREYVLKNSNGDATKLLFIRHTSQYFSWAKWGVFAQQHLQSELDNLKSKALLKMK